MILSGSRPESAPASLAHCERCRCGHARHEHTLADALSFRSRALACELCACFRFVPRSESTATELLPLKK